MLRLSSSNRPETAPPFPDNAGVAVRLLYGFWPPPLRRISTADGLLCVKQKREQNCQHQHGLPRQSQHADKDLHRAWYFQL